VSVSYRIYIFVLGLLGLVLGSLLGFHWGGILGMSAVGPMGAMFGFWIAAMGRQIVVFVLELIT
jgi:hypothetical protein